jgi:hypothetical protein
MCGGRWSIRTPPRVFGPLRRPALIAALIAAVPVRRAGAAGYQEIELIAVTEACADAARDLWQAHARNLGDLYGAPVVEATAELVSEVTRVFLRKLPGQIVIGLAIATVTRPRVVAAA